MTLEERSNLVLAFARVLYVNGQATDQTLAAAERLGDTLGLRAKILPRWGELQLQAEDGDVQIISAVAADPTGVDMDRVASTMRAIEELRVGRLAPAAAMEAITTISKTPPAPTWLFTLAAAAGAVALAVIFGVQHLAASVAHIRECGGRRSSAPLLGPVQRKHLPATVLRGVARRRYRRAGGSIPIEFVASACRGLPMHGPGARAACAQWCVGSHQGPHPSRRCPTDLCGARRCGDFDGTAAWTRPS